MKRELAIAAALLATLPAMAQKRAAVGNDIDIAKGDTASEVSCVKCSVHVHGTVDGKLAVVMGNVDVDGTLNGKTAIVHGNLHVLSGGVVTGTVAIEDGQVIQDPDSHFSAEVTHTRSHVVGYAIFFGILILLVPLLIVVALIWLIVWLVRRNRAPMYPPPPPPLGGYPPAR